MDTSLWHYWEVVQLLVGGAKCEEVDDWGLALKGYALSLSPFFLSLLPSCHEMSGFAPLSSPYHVLSPLGPETMQLSDHELEPTDHRLKLEVTWTSETTSPN